jgi:hypothetical protein
MAGLTKQHFKEIAKILNDCPNEEDRKEAFTKEEINAFKMLREKITFDLSNYFKTQNPLFNENQFKKACLE